MLPGFRILIATIVLSASVLIFGLGAAALLRSAHEEFVSIPSWRAAQQPLGTGTPSLALLRVEQAPAAVDKTRLDGPKAASVDPDASSEPKAETAEPAKPKVRRSRRHRARAATHRRREVHRVQRARTVQQMYPDNSLQALFGGT